MHWATCDQDPDRRLRWGDASVSSKAMYLMAVLVPNSLPGSAAVAGDAALGPAVVRAEQRRQVQAGQQRRLGRQRNAQLAQRLVHALCAVPNAAQRRFMCSCK